MRNVDEQSLDYFCCAGASRLLGLLLCFGTSYACAGTESGNPTAQIEVVVDVSSSDSEVASLRDNAGGLQITKVEVSHFQLEFDRRCTAKDQASFSKSVGHEVDLLTLGTTFVESGQYCGVALLFGKRDPETEGDGLSVVIDAKRLDGVPVRIDLEQEIQVASDTLYTLLESQSRSVRITVQIDLARWFQGLELDTLPVGDEGELVVSSGTHEGILQRLVNNIETSTRIVEEAVSSSNDAVTVVPEMFGQETVASPTSLQSLALGDSHSCVIRGEERHVLCFGRNLGGQLGRGTSGTSFDDYLPKKVEDLTNVSSVVAGDSHTCALKTDGKLFCWGSNEEGQLGVGQSMPDVLEPTFVLNDVLQVGAGKTHTCALTNSKTVLCWGSNDVGQLGLGTQGAVNEYLPKATELPADFAQQLAVGGDHACIVTSAGVMLCWGNNSHGQLGHEQGGSGEFEPNPVLVKNLGSVPAGAVTSASLGRLHTCALTDKKTVWCWGNAAQGQLGISVSGTDEFRTVPYNLSIGEDMGAVFSGGVHTCGLSVSGAVWCWGNSGKGQVGTGATGSGQLFTSPQPVSLSSVDFMSLGDEHSCAMNQSELWCWGNNLDGQVGTQPRSTALEFDLPTTVVF